MVWLHTRRRTWWEDREPTIVQKVTKELKYLGIDAEIKYSKQNHKWKMVFLTQEDRNLYKLIGKYGKDRRIAHSIKRV